jgi:hypothetical protein
MNLFPQHSFIQVALVTLCSPLLHSQSVWNDARNDLLSKSPYTRRILEEIKQNCPGFTLGLTGDMALPKATQLRTVGSGKYVGALNIRRIDIKTEAPETAIAGFYHLIHMEKVQHQPASMKSWVDFQNKVREELRKADPARYGHLRKLREVQSLAH